MFVYEPGVPIRGQLTADWLDDYQRLLKSGDRRGAFAWVIKRAGFAPAALTVMPLRYVRLVLRLAIRGPTWERMDHLLEANLVEHRLQATLDAPGLERFASIAAHSVLMAGTKSPAAISAPLLDELANDIPNSTVQILPGLGHLAPEDHPARIAITLLRQASDPPTGSTAEP